ncbi:MarR family transcriptional regulator [Nakamurella sp. YIM 132087]|uniref:MarR family transcriptional regulator n=1 Tax=Nakamurella alba TaxID=2665158 RepID=A0A7K1FS67_9ACTN|nr:MarR family transcriptional regulator [Nakamurella alba]MTD16981.1 MarR family transcriptional regulator [Nakamurella alba]
MPDIAPLANELRLSIHRLTRRLRQQQPESEMTLTQLSALAIVWREGPLTAGDLAAREQVRPPSITRVVDGLEAAGMVFRKANPADGRQVLVEITEQGASRMEEYVRLRQEWLAEQLVTLSARDREVLKRAATIMNELALR